MKTWQDFKNLTDEDERKKFIVSLVNDWKNGDLYRNAIEAKKYNNQENTAINARRFTIQTKIKDKDGNLINSIKENNYRANNKIANGIFHKLITQKTQYLLGDGISIDIKQKKKLGKNIDQKTQQAGMEASLSSVSWAYCYLAEGKFQTEIFKGEELIPLEDEDTGIMMAAVRFYERADKNIIFYELYEIDGVTKFKRRQNDQLTVLQPKKAYAVNQRLFSFTEEVITLSEQNVNMLPLIPYYNNTAYTSDFNTGLKSQLDLYDIILSDFGNNLEDSKDIYWVLKNYDPGKDVGQFLEELEAYKAIPTSNEGDATSHTIEIPYSARETALNILRRQIISDYMGLDLDTIKGSSLTNVAIQAAYTDLDLKVAEFEWGALDFVRGIIELMQKFTGDTEEIIVNDFNRRTITNDSEIITNLAASPLLSEQTRIERNPLAAPDEIERLTLEGQRFGILEENDEGNSSNPDEGVAHNPETRAEAEKRIEEDLNKKGYTKGDIYCLEKDNYCYIMPHGIEEIEAKKAYAEKRKEGWSQERAAKYAHGIQSKIRGED